MPNNYDAMVYTENLEKTYYIGEEKIEVLKELTLSIPKAKFIALRGPSGSGKTTLLNIIGGIDRQQAAKSLWTDKI